MKVVVIALPILFAYVSGPSPVRAADSCKDCRDYQRAWVKAHTREPHARANTTSV
jgi:hypothetical protein